jgi:hypothetical protein
MAQNPCSGRLLRRALFLTGIAAALAYGQSQSKPVAKKTAAHRANELTLAGLRPGKDTLARAALLNKPLGTGQDLMDQQTAWYDKCRDVSLTLDSDREKRVQVIRVGAWVGSKADCTKMSQGPWRTGLGLQVTDPAEKARALYGEPDSRSPSTRDGQPLELWYYQFDWAGADVPQVMEVLCTKKEGEPSRVVEITLAAPSL